MVRRAHFDRLYLLALWYGHRDREARGDDRIRRRGADEVAELNDRIPAKLADFHVHPRVGVGGDERRRTLQDSAGQAVVSHRVVLLQVRPPGQVAEINELALAEEVGGLIRAR